MGPWTRQNPVWSTPMAVTARHMIEPFPAGGTADCALRALQPALQRSLGQSVVIFSHGGAGGAIGTTAVTSSKAEDHTLLLTFSTLAGLPEQAIVNRRPPFALDQLLPVARPASDEAAIVVHAHSPYRTAAELIVAAKARPGQVAYASSGNYGPSHLPVAMPAEAADAQSAIFPIPGTSFATSDASNDGSLRYHVRAGYT